MQEHAKLILGLNKFLASSYSLMLKLHNYHWNVTGANFKSLHEMFEEQYTELFATVDEIAERIRQKDELVDATLPSFNKNTIISAPDCTKTSNNMLQEIEADHMKLHDFAFELMQIAAELNDDVTSDLMIKRQQQHSKFAWFCKSSFES